MFTGMKARNFVHTFELSEVSTNLHEPVHLT